MALMRRTYSTADNVTVYLHGVRERDADALMAGSELISSVEKPEWDRIFTEAENYKHRHLGGSSRVAATFAQLHVHFMSLQKLLAPLCLPHHRDHFWTAFNRLKRHVWFQRAWVIQEFALARQVRFVLGRRSLTEEPFRLGLERAADCHPFVRETLTIYGSLFTYCWTRVKISLPAWIFVAFILSGFRTLSSFEHDRSAVRQNALRVDLFWTRRVVQLRANDSASWTVHLPKRSFANPLAAGNLFLRFRYWDCSDPRDRLYSLLGIADDQDTTPLYIIYEESMRTVCCRLARYLVENGLGGKVLYLADPSSNDIPSRANILLNLSFNDGFLQARATALGHNDWALFRANGSATTFPFSFLSNGTHLRTRGVLLGSVLTQTAALLAEAAGSVPRILVDMAVWFVETARWLRQETPPDQRAIFRQGYFRAMFCDLMLDSSLKYIRIGDSPEGKALLQSVEATISILEDADGESRYRRLRAIPAFGRSFGRTSRLASGLLQPILSGRRIGVAAHALGELPLHLNMVKSKATVGSPSEPYGWVCQLPGATELGGEVAIINGCEIPFVLRRNLQTGTFRIVGACYVSRMMDGDKNELRRWP